MTVDWKWAVERRSLLAMIPALTIAGCGGGGGGGETSATPTGPVVTPTPTPPAPNPPTPTPPAPNINSEMAMDFSRDRTFNAIGIRVAIPATMGGVVESRIDPENTAIGFSFTAATRTYHARYFGEMIDAPTQTLAYSTAGNFSYDEYSASDRGVYFVRSPGVNGLNYLGSITWNTGGIYRYLLFGARALSTDLPTSGIKTFAESPTAEGSTIVVDFNTRSVTVTTSYQPSGLGNTGSAFNLPARVPVRMSGILDPTTGRISGSVSYNGEAPAGTFEGALYGPAAAEAGLLFKVQRTNGDLFYSFVLTRS